MNIIVVAPAYPHLGYPYAGVFNERSVLALSKLADHVEALVPKTYVPFFLACVPRWKLLKSVIGYEVRNNIAVHRPSIIRIPKIGAAIWLNFSAYLCCRNLTARLHRKFKFDAIISFDLMNAGGLAWRLGKNLNVPVFGWSTGSDVRVNPYSALGRAVISTIQNLDFIFYQSAELLELASKLTKSSTNTMLSGNHMILPRGIPAPYIKDLNDMRRTVRLSWGVRDDDIVLLSIGRITKEKGVFELLNAISLLPSSVNNISCILIGSIPEWDESEVIKKKLRNDPVLNNKVRILPACHPDEIWSILSGADIFAFTSHKEGMPNSLLEAMAMGLPSIAFAIPAVEELDAGTCSVLKIPPFNIELFAKAIEELSASPEQREKLGDAGKRRVREQFNVERNMARAIEKIREIIKR